jgi:hypothetical protein
MPLAGCSTHREVLRLNLDGAPDLYDVPRDGKSTGLVWFQSGEADLRPMAAAGSRTVSHNSEGSRHFMGTRLGTP